MAKMLAGRAYAVGVFLLLTVQANGKGMAYSGNRSAAERENAPLRIAQVAPDATQKLFRGVGIVTAIEPAGTLTINHEAIQGLMPAMEMTFSVDPRALADGVRPGDEIDFSVDGKTYTIHDLKVRGHIQ